MSLKGSGGHGSAKTNSRLSTKRTGKEIRNTKKCSIHKNAEGTASPQGDASNKGQRPYPQDWVESIQPQNLQDPVQGDGGGQRSGSQHAEQRLTRQAVPREQKDGGPSQAPMPWTRCGGREQRQISVHNEPLCGIGLTTVMPLASYCYEVGRCTALSQRPCTCRQ